MIVKLTWAGLVISLSLFALTQLFKFAFKKWSKLSKVVPYLPLIILGVSFIIYIIFLKGWLDAVVNSIIVTAFSCYTYDIWKAIRGLFIKEKEKN